MGVSINPHSWIWVTPVSSPAPLSTKLPAMGRSRNTSSHGMMAVTPVRTGPLPGELRPSPSMMVLCPTRTPGTSVMALPGPTG